MVAAWILWLIISASPSQEPAVHHQFGVQISRIGQFYSLRRDSWILIQLLYVLRQDKWILMKLLYVLRHYGRVLRTCNSSLASSQSADFKHVAEGRRNVSSQRKFVANSPCPGPLWVSNNRARSQSQPKATLLPSFVHKNFVHMAQALKILKKNWTVRCSRVIRSSFLSTSSLKSAIWSCVPKIVDHSQWCRRTKNPVKSLLSTQQFLERIDVAPWTKILKISALQNVTKLYGFSQCVPRNLVAWRITLSFCPIPSHCKEAPRRSSARRALLWSSLLLRKKISETD